MSHLAQPHWVELMGALIGVLGITIAIYLQLITRKKCPPRYVILFLVFGIIMIMMHSGPLVRTRQELTFLRVSAYIILAILEIGTAYYVWKRLDLDNPFKELHNELFSDSES